MKKIFEFLAGALVLMVVFGGIAYAVLQDLTLPEVHKVWPTKEVVKVFVIENGHERVVENPKEWFSEYTGTYHTVWVGK